MYQLYCIKFSSTNQNVNLVLLDEPGRVRSQIINVVYQIQRFDFVCNLVVTRKVIRKTNMNRPTFTFKTSIAKFRSMEVFCNTNSYYTGYLLYHPCMHPCYHHGT